MSRGNLETVREMYERRERGDMHAGDYRFEVEEMIDTLLTLRDG